MAPSGPDRNGISEGGLFCLLLTWPSLSPTQLIGPVAGDDDSFAGSRTRVEELSSWIRHLLLSRNFPGVPEGTSEGPAFSTE